MDAGMDADALVVADEAMALAVEHDLRVDRTDLTSILARLSESAGDPRESIRRLEGVVAEWTSDPDLALLRAMHILASVHYRQGDHAAALAGVRAQPGRGPSGGPGVVRLRGRQPVDGRDDRVRDGGVGPRRRARRPRGRRRDAVLGRCEHRRGRRRTSGGARRGSAQELLASHPPVVVGGREDRGPARAGPPSTCSAATVTSTGCSTVHDEVVTFLRGLWGAGPGGGRGAAGRPGRGPPRDRHPDGAAGAARDAAGAGRACRDDAMAVWGEGSLLPPPTLEGRAGGPGPGRERSGPAGPAGDDVAVEALVAAWREVVDLFEQYGEPLRGGA